MVFRNGKKLKINLLYDMFVFDEVLQGLHDHLIAQGHDVNHVTEFVSDDSDMTLSTGFLNIYDTLRDMDPESYSGEIVHWLVELSPLGPNTAPISLERLKQFHPIHHKFDRIFVRDQRQLEALPKHIPMVSPAGVLSCCPNPQLHKRLHVEKKYDVLFYGNMTPRRESAITKLLDAGIKVTVPDGLVRGAEKIRLINESKIVLNINAEDSDAFGTYRTCECLGSGGFLLTERFGWVPYGLKDGRDFSSFSLPGIVDAVRHHLNHDDERRRVADTGHRSMWRNITWEREMKKLLPSISTKKGFMHGRKYFFITGCQRSGTTLMELMLDSHPDIAVFGEPGSYEKLDNRNPQPIDKALGFKIPVWSHRYRHCAAEFPEAKVIYMTRDIKSTVASMLAYPRWIRTELQPEVDRVMKGLDEDLRTPLRSVLEDSYSPLRATTVLAYGKLLLHRNWTQTHNTLLVQYEDLVREPQKTAEAVLRHVGLPWDDRVLQHEKLHKGVYMGMTDSQRAIDRLAVHKWQKVLTAEQAAEIDQLTRRLQDALPVDMKMTCPVCAGTEFTDYAKSPAYKVCSGCGLLRQRHLPTKTYEGAEENFGDGPGMGHMMSDTDKRANRILASSLYEMFKPRMVLDVGSKYPYFLAMLKDKCPVLGCDGIPDIKKYGEELGVRVLQEDVEGSNFDHCDADLITMVHVLEHLYKPRTTIRNVLSRLTDRGVLFIRTPDPSAQGIERDLTAHHLTIHPYLHTRKSIELLVEPHGFEVFRHDRMDGHGQSDYYIRKKKVSATVSVCMIVKNEEKNVADALESVKALADEIIVVDTGSVDKTKDVVNRYTDKIYDFEWCDDFSAARNFSIEKASCDYILWMDADDILQNTAAVRRELREDRDAYNANILYGNDTFTHIRLFRNKRGVRFKGMVHEVPDLNGMQHKVHTGINVLHKTVKHSTEDRTQRNYRILEKELRAHPDSTRTMFYMANTLRDLGRHDEAITLYRKYQKHATWDEEKWMSHKYVANMLMGRKEWKTAIDELLKAVSVDDRWAESYYYIGECYFHLGETDRCMNWMRMAADTPDHGATLFKETRVYQDLPWRYLAACHEKKGEIEDALRCTQTALDRLPGGDQWLTGRIDHFKQKMSEQPPLTTHEVPEGTTEVFECYRQGALGDCIMTTAALRALKQKDPKCWIRYVTHEKSAPILRGNRYIDQLLTKAPAANSSTKVHFCYPDRDSTLKDEGYPEKPLNRHLVQIFNECAGIPDAGMTTHVTVPEERRAFSDKVFREIGPFVTLHAKAGWSPYKEWDVDKWGALVARIRGLGLLVVQVGSKTDPFIPNPGMSRSAVARDFRDDDVMTAVALIQKAHLHVGIDSFPQHAAHAVGTKAVVLFGSTSPVGSGYEGNENIWKGHDCSPCYREYEWAKDPRGECPHGHRCMKEITVEEVFEAVRKILSQNM